jgi:hypothetical protein
LNDKKDTSQSRLETHVWASYLRATQEKKCLEILQQQIFTCPNDLGAQDLNSQDRGVTEKTVLLCEIAPTEEIFYAAQKTSTAPETHPHTLHGETPNATETEPPPHGWPEKPAPEISAPPQEPFVLETFFPAKKRSLGAMEKGLQAHAQALFDPEDLEHQWGSSFLKRSQLYRQEFEVWSQHARDGHLSKIGRCVFDLLILYNRGDFEECFLDCRQGLAVAGAAAPAVFEHTAWVWVVVDLKTGSVNHEHQEQIKRYLKIFNDLLQDKSEAQVFGLLWYRNLGMKVWVEQNVENI